MSRKSKSYKESIDGWFRQRRQEIIDCGGDPDNPWPRFYNLWLRDEFNIWHYVENNILSYWYTSCSGKELYTSGTMFHPDHFPPYDRCETCYRLRIMKELAL